MPRGSAKASFNGFGRLVLSCLVLTMSGAQAAVVTTHPVMPVFSRLALSGRFDLDYVQGAGQSVSIAGDRYLVENLRVAVRDGVLRIVRPHGFDLPKADVVTIRIRSGRLVSLQTSGLVRAKLSGLRGPAFSLVNDGAVAATMTGGVGKFSIASRGVASIDAGALQAADLTMLVRGQGNFRVFASRSAKVKMYGEGRIEVLGHPPKHEFKALAYGVISLK